MTPLELLGDLIMALLGLITKTSAVTIPLSGVMIVMFIIFNDEFLSHHIFLTFALTVLFSFTCCLLTLSKVCVLRRKPYAKGRAVDQLWDSDLTYENETEEVPHYKVSYHLKDIGCTLKNFFYKNPCEFCKFRPAYGMFLITGFVSLLAFIGAISQIKEWNKKDDFYCVVLELTVPMILLIFLVYFIANTGFYTAEKDYDIYTPFEEFIQIPMKIIVGKTVAIFVAGEGTHWLFTIFLLFIIAMTFISSNYLYHVSNIGGALKDLLPPLFPDPRKFLKTVLIVIIVSCVNALIGMVAACFVEAKKSILGVIEKNWQRNIGAISFLLPDTEAETLMDLKTVLGHKREQPLTEKEVTAFNYISWPIWRTKQPFMLRNFERDDASVPESFNVQEPNNHAEPENIQPLAAAAASKQINESVHGDQPSLASSEVIKLESSETSELEKLRLQEKPSTSITVSKESKFHEKSSTSV